MKKIRKIRILDLWHRPRWTAFTDYIRLLLCDCFRLFILVGFYRVAYYAERY